MMTPDEVRQMIAAGLPDARVEVRDMTGTGDHFEITVSSAGFKGKTLVEQHRMVFSLLGDEMDRRIHAVQLKTKPL
ncbi:MAG: BolA family transcriptional regulator [Candidatus Omnitrophica bacterium]|nr:BolA family transcriptional regulator [Candidatus Omnitrophota bacterium]